METLVFIITGVYSLCMQWFAEAEGRRDDDPKNNRSGIIKLGAIRGIIDKVSIIIIWEMYVWFAETQFSGASWQYSSVDSV